MRKLDESLLGHIPPFRNLSRPEIRAVLDLAEPRRFAASTAIFDEGQFAERFYLLLDGHIRVIRTTEGGDQVIALHIVAGQLFGIAAAIGRDTYPATAMSVDDCLVLSWPTNQWSKFIATYDGCVLNLPWSVYT